MANQTTIVLPISIGDIIYKKCRRVKSCRYSNDEYAKDGQPHCLQHEYDCDDCDAIFEYYVEPIKVNDIILSNFADEIIRGISEYASDMYLISEKDAKDWVSSHTK